MLIDTHMYMCMCRHMYIYIYIHIYIYRCDDTSKNAGFAIETAEKAVKSLSAKIGEETAAIEV